MLGGYTRSRGTPATKPRGVFGTLRVSKSALTPEQRDLYRGHFCALCHGLDAWGGKLTSLLTNYDTTFWLLVLAALEEQAQGATPRVLRKPCTALAWRKVPVVELSVESRKLAAALTLALAGAKVEDDAHDGDRPWVAWAFLPLRPSWRKAAPWLDQVGFPRDAVEGLGAWQRALEAEATSLRELTRPTQELLASLFGFLAQHTQQENLREPLEELGRALGIWIYLWDAWQDRQRDQRSGAFNALLRFPLDDEELAQHLLHALNHVQRALALLPLGARRPLLDQHLLRLRQLTVRDLPKPRCSALACWVLGGAALAATPQASVACDGCDCGGCDGCSCDGCSCEGCSCDGCNSCGCEGCNGCEVCSGCEKVGHCGSCGEGGAGLDCCSCGCDCCPTCDIPEAACCECCCDSDVWDCCICIDTVDDMTYVDTGSRTQDPPGSDSDSTSAVPGTRPAARKTWKPFRRVRKKKPLKEGEKPGPAEPPVEDSGGGEEPP